MTRPNTAARKLMMLRLPAVLRLFTCHLRIRSVAEQMDPEALTEAAHELLAMASDAERAQMRSERNAA